MEEQNTCFFFLFQTKAAFKANRYLDIQVKKQSKYKKKKTCTLRSCLLIVTPFKCIMVYSKCYLTVELFWQISHVSFQ